MINPFFRNNGPFKLSDILQLINLDDLNIEAIRSHGRVWKYKGEAFVAGKKMADAQWSATIVDKK